jgi:hypothetical protein
MLVSFLEVEITPNAGLLPPQLGCRWHRLDIYLPGVSYYGCISIRVGRPFHAKQVPMAYKKPQICPLRVDDLQYKP